MTVIQHTHTHTQPEQVTPGPHHMNNSQENISSSSCSL